MEWKVNVAAVLCLKTTDVECWRSVSLNKSLTCHNTEHQQSCEARHVGDVMLDNVRNGESDYCCLCLVQSAF